VTVSFNILGNSPASRHSWSIQQGRCKGIASDWNGRRHTSAGQQAAIVSSCQNWADSHSHGGDRKSDQGATLHLDTVADRTAVSGASQRTQKDADSVAKACFAKQIQIQSSIDSRSIPKRRSISASDTPTKASCSVDSRTKVCSAFPLACHRFLFSPILSINPRKYKVSFSLSGCS
jgi:hypothetical protein